MADASFPSLAALRAFKGLATTALVVARTTFGDGGGGTFAVKEGDASNDDDAMIIVDALNRRWRRVYGGPASVKWWGAKGDGIADDTQALRAFFGANGPIHGYIPAGNYRVTGYIRMSGANRLIEGSVGAAISMDTAATFDGEVYRIQPLLLMDSTTDSSTIRGFTLNLNGHFWPAWPTSDFTKEIFNEGHPRDPLGSALMVMGDKSRVEGMFILNGWDNCISVGKFDESTGANTPGPDQPIISRCHTFNGGCGEHAWPTGIALFFRMGAGIDFLHATNFVCDSCTDFGSTYGFFADITGGDRGTFTGCVSEAAQHSGIWSDTAEGGNQLWNQGGFGQTVTGTSAGWLKTPGGTAFYSASYGVSFVNCVADSPALYGFALDYAATKNVLTNCRVRNSGASAFVVSSRDHKLISPVVEGCCLQDGTTAPSGSVYPDQPAILVTGMHDLNQDVDVPGSVEIVAPIVSPGQEYEIIAPLPPPKYNYAICARTYNGVPCKVHLLGGTQITPGTAGLFLAGTGSTIFALTTDGDHFAVHAEGGIATFNLIQGGNPALQLAQDASGNVTIHNYKTDGVTAITQARIDGDSKGILIWSGAVRLLNPPTSPSGLYSGDLWVDGAASNVVKAVP